MKQTVWVKKVDSTPTQNSENLVESGGVYSELAGKQGALTFDNVPINESTNPVTSGGVYNAEQSVRNTVSIVATGNTAPKAITAGEFVQWQGAIYTATTNIANGAALSTANLQAVTGGGLNALKSSVDALNSSLYTIITSGSLKTFAMNISEGFTCFRYNNSVTDTPCQYGHGYVVHYGQNIRIVVFDMTTTSEYTMFSQTSGSQWSNWEEIALNSKLDNVIRCSFSGGTPLAENDTYQLPYFSESKAFAILMRRYGYAGSTMLTKFAITNQAVSNVTLQYTSGTSSDNKTVFSINESGLLTIKSTTNPVFVECVSYK